MATQEELAALWEQAAPVAEPSQEDLAALWEQAAPIAAAPAAPEQFADVPPMDPAALADWQAQGRPEPAPEPTFGERVIGAGETALTALTGATGGAAGMIGGALGGVAGAIGAGEFGTPAGAERIQQSAEEAAAALTYAPRTEAGQEMVQELGELTQALPPVIAGVPPGIGAGVGTQLRRGAPSIVREAKPKPGSVGAAAIEQADARQLLAEELPIPIKLTKGQRERGFEQQKFERETAKSEEGESLRARFAEQNTQLNQNLDSFIDTSGGEAFELRDVGLSVDKALRARAARDKADIRKQYKAADEAGELAEPVELPSFVKHLNDSAPEAEVANVLKAVRAKAIKLGAAVEGPDGELIPQSVSLKNAETLRKSINAATNEEAPNIRQAAILKQMADDDTADAGGNVYKQARATRARFAQNYENIGLVKRLLGTKKGSSDRVIAMENVLDDAILKAPLDDVRQVRRLLQTEGESGNQAWRDLQGGTLQHIRDVAYGGMQIDQAGNRVISPAKLNQTITKLDKSGKLDFIFTKKGAEQLRTVNEVAQDLMTSPPGSVNYSNTSSALLGALDLGSVAVTGLPVPIASILRHMGRKLKGRKVKQRVREALEPVTPVQSAPAPVPPQAAAAPAESSRVLAMQERLQKTSRDLGTGGLVG